MALGWKNRNRNSSIVPQTRFYVTQFREQNAKTDFPLIHFLFSASIRNPWRLSSGRNKWIINSDVNLQNYCWIWFLCLDERNLGHLNLFGFPIWIHILHQLERRRANKFVWKVEICQSGCWLNSRYYLVLDIIRGRLNGAKNRERICVTVKSQW